MLRYNNMRHRELPLSTDSSNLFLKVMISIAVFLFAVTLAGVLSINSMLVNWNSSILGSLTVQIILGFSFTEASELVSMSNNLRGGCFKIFPQVGADLSAVRPVDFITVVLRRIVGLR